MTAGLDAIVFSGLRLAPEGVGMLDGERILRHVPRSELEKLELRHGFLSRHPLVQAAFGAGVSYLGLEPAARIFDWFRHGGNIVDVLAFLALLVPAGAWMIYDASRRGYFVVVRSRTESLRIPLRGRPTQGELASLVEQASDRLGYVIVNTTRRDPA